MSFERFAYVAAFTGWGLILVVGLLVQFDVRPLSALGYDNTYRRAIIDELDKGFYVVCENENNPYPYAKWAVDTRVDAVSQAVLCFDKGRGWPVWDELKGKRKAAK